MGEAYLSTGTETESWMDADHLEKGHSYTELYLPHMSSQVRSAELSWKFDCDIAGAPLEALLNRRCPFIPQDRGCDLRGNLAG
jgi:hypothetical protein